ncbi:MAG: hypothetical protein SFV23_21110 [Planctomycetaceae bacterium]|nr:hypothetical protein [Planctomycetaceae bacterium]
MLATLSEERLADAVDLLKELINVGVGRAAASLSELIGLRIELSVPEVWTSCDGREISGALNERAAMVVWQEFTGDLCGRAALAFPEASGLSLAALLAGSDVPASELDLELSGVLLEVGNILLNGMMGTIANEAHNTLQYMLPVLHCGGDALTRVLQSDSYESMELLIADVRFRVQERAINGSIVIGFSFGSVLQLLTSVQPELPVPNLESFEDQVFQAE